MAGHQLLSTGQSNPDSANNSAPQYCRDTVTPQSAVRSCTNFEVDCSLDFAVDFSFSTFCFDESVEITHSLLPQVSSFNFPATAGPDLLTPNCLDYESNAYTDRAMFESTPEDDGTQVLASASDDPHTTAVKAGHHASGWQTQPTALPPSAFLQPAGSDNHPVLSHECDTPQTQGPPTPHFGSYGVSTNSSTPILASTPLQNLRPARTTSACVDNVQHGVLSLYQTPAYVTTTPQLSIETAMPEVNNSSPHFPISFEYGYVAPIYRQAQQYDSIDATAQQPGQTPWDEFSPSLPATYPPIPHPFPYNSCTPEPSPPQTRPKSTTRRRTTTSRVQKSPSPRRRRARSLDAQNRRRSVPRAKASQGTGDEDSAEHSQEDCMDMSIDQSFLEVHTAPLTRFEDLKLEDKVLIETVFRHRHAVDRSVGRAEFWNDTIDLLHQDPRYEKPRNPKPGCYQMRFGRKKQEITPWKVEHVSVEANRRNP